MVLAGILLIPLHMRRNLIRVIVGLFLLAAAACSVVPNIIHPRTHRAAAPCINNLRQLDGAKQQWQLEYRKTTNDIPTLDDLKPYVRLDANGEIPRCPEGGTYILGRVGEDPRCSLGGIPLFTKVMPNEPRWNPESFGSDSLK